MDEKSGWLAEAPRAAADYASDAALYQRFWQKGETLLRRLPPKPARHAAEAEAAASILDALRQSRERFCDAHAVTLYRALTDELRRFLRVDALVEAAAAALPGLVPAPSSLAREPALAQRDKDGAEIDQGIFLAAVLADPTAGMHLCHAMLLPRPEAAARAEEFRIAGALDLGAALVERHGAAIHVTMRNPRYLNAEDEGTIDALETAIDVATLDPRSAIGVLRGAPVPHPKWQGRRVFNAGINLTHLYQGKISYLWYLRRDLGLVNKLFRGVARPDRSPDEIHGGTIEKPWLGAVDGFAIGGGCQLLLALDYVVAASDAYLTLPARKEGIIPGAANLRLPRFTGDRIARQAILSGRRIDCAAPEGRLVCDEIVAPDAMDEAIDRAIADFTGSGVVSAAGNRRALRVGMEPLDLFRRYMAVYAREQAYCHFSPALIANLERHWNAANRAG
ncbi:MAG TPA: enoyl-CoA hydratase/isomerase family protein [Stellaceae bacterium]|nr:enoyl-CoA hydratase/isomerase family protein [Stellaceae bacterium]